MSHALVLVLSLVVQAKTVEPIPPQDDPEIRRVLGRAYLDWNRAMREAEESARKAPIKKRSAFLERFRHTKESEFRKRFALSEADMKYLMEYGKGAALPMSTDEPKPAVPPTRRDVEGLRGVLVDARERAKVEEQRYSDDLERVKRSRGLSTAGQTMSIDQYLGGIQQAALNPIPEPPCGMKTRLGTACTRKVPSGGPCWWHREHPPNPTPSRRPRR